MGDRGYGTNISRSYIDFGGIQLTIPTIRDTLIKTFFTKQRMTSIERKSFLIPQRRLGHFQDVHQDILAGRTPEDWIAE